MTTKEASTLKYIGVYLLAVFPYNLVSTILVGLTAEAMFTNLSVAIIITIFDLAIWCGIFIYVYSRFDDINVHKVMPYVAIFVVLGILYTLYIFGPLSFLDNYYFIVFLAIAEPIAFLYIFYNYFQTKTYYFI